MAILATAIIAITAHTGNNGNNGNNCKYVGNNCINNNDSCAWTPNKDSFHTVSVGWLRYPGLGTLIVEKHSLSTGASREAPVDNECFLPKPRAIVAILANTGNTLQ